MGNRVGPSIQLHCSGYRQPQKAPSNVQSIQVQTTLAFLARESCPCPNAIVSKKSFVPIANRELDVQTRISCRPVSYALTAEADHVCVVWCIVLCSRNRIECMKVGGIVAIIIKQTLVCNWLNSETITNSTTPELISFPKRARQAKSRSGPNFKLKQIVAPTLNSSTLVCS
jgi:hypothetical protein